MIRTTFLLIFTFIIFFSSSAHALSITGKNNLDQIVITLLKQNLLDDRYNDSPDIGEIICKAGGGNYCTGVSIGEGICQAGGGNYCTGVSINEALNKLPKHDTDWAWDQFHHSTGSLVWACRGIQTGQFAEHTRCAEKSKNDNRWPNK